MVDEKRLKTVGNYAKLRKCHRNWVYQLIDRGEIKPIKIDGVIFIKLKENE